MTRLTVGGTNLPKPGEACGRCCRRVWEAAPYMFETGKAVLADVQTVSVLAAVYGSGCRRFQ